MSGWWTGGLLVQSSCSKSSCFVFAFAVAISIGLAHIKSYPQMSCKYQPHV